MRKAETSRTSTVWLSIKNDHSTTARWKVLDEFVKKINLTIFTQVLSAVYRLQYTIVFILQSRFT
jgi:hypothetical protein